MKKLMMLILAMVLCVPALAESTAAIPVEIVEERAQNHIQVGLSEAIAKAQAEMPVKPDKQQTRAELVEMSDGTFRWVVTVFDLTSLSDGWCVELDASSGAVEASYTAYNGYFLDVHDLWTAQKGVHELWSMEDKQLYDALYAMTPAYGLPMPGDMSAEDALKKALFLLGLDDAGSYEVGCGYLMGSEGVGGVWEICLVIDGQVACRANLDAVTGEVYYLGLDELEADDANG